MRHLRYWFGMLREEPGLVVPLAILGLLFFVVGTITWGLLTSP